MQAEACAPAFAGCLDAMCSRAEAEERERGRALHRFEWKTGASSESPAVDISRVTKKYSRSAAGRSYVPEEVRSPAACFRTCHFLIDEVLDLDLRESTSFSEVYGYMTDRLRSVRADLHLQTHGTRRTEIFIRTHECCLRFEVLGRALLRLDPKTPEGFYSEKHGMHALSQCLEPVLAAYRADREGNYKSPHEAAILRYVLLLLLDSSPSSLPAQLSALRPELLRCKVLRPVMKACSDFLSGDYVAFLRFIRTSEFLTCAAAGGLTDLARLRVLYIAAQSYPKAIGDRLPLASLVKLLAFGSEAHCRSFLTFYGIAVEESPPAAVLPRAAAAALPAVLSQGLPGSSGFRGRDELLAAKAALQTRSSIVLGVEEPSWTALPEEPP